MSSGQICTPDVTSQSFGERVALDARDNRYFEAQDFETSVQEKGGTRPA